MNLTLSLIGKIATIKMSVLSKINYIFTMIHIQPTKKWFGTLNNKINHFYWNNKNPRISINTLQKNKDMGGLGAPNHYYYLVAQLQFLCKWINGNNLHNPWSDLEQAECKKIPLSDHYITDVIKVHNIYNNMTIRTTLLVWWEILKITPNPVTPHSFSPI